MDSSVKSWFALHICIGVCLLLPEFLFGVHVSSVRQWLFSWQNKDDTFFCILVFSRKLFSCSGSVGQIHYAYHDSYMDVDFKYEIWIMSHLSIIPYLVEWRFKRSYCYALTLPNTVTHIEPTIWRQIESHRSFEINPQCFPRRMIYGAISHSFYCFISMIYWSVPLDVIYHGAIT